MGLLAGGTALAQGVSVLASPLLTRLYSPEDFGVLAVFAALLGMLAVVASLRYDLAIPLPGSDDDALSLLLLSLCIVTIVSCIGALVIWLFPESIANLLNARQLRPYLWLLPVGIVTTGTYQALSSWAVRQRAFGALARTKLNQGIGGTGTQIVGGALSSSPAGLIVGQLLGQSAGILTLARQVWPRARVSSTWLQSALRGAVRYRHFLFFGTPAALMNSAGLQLPGLLLASLYGVESAGWYLLSRRVIGAPIDLIGRSVSQVYFGEAAVAARSSISAMRSLFLKFAFRLLALGVIPVMALLIFSPTVFRLVFGPSWDPAAVFTQLLCLMLLAQFIVAPLSQTFVILERQHFSLSLNALKVTIAFSSFYIPHTMGLPVTSAVLTYSVGMFLYYVLVFAVSLSLMHRLRDVRAQ